VRDESEHVGEAKPRSHSRPEAYFFEHACLDEPADAALADVEPAPGLGFGDQRMPGVSLPAGSIGLVVPHLTRKAAVPETPEKPVTGMSAAPTMWSLAFGLGLSTEQARRFQRAYVLASDPAGESAASAAVLLGWRWQQLTARVADDEFTAPWAIELHHLVADVLVQRDAPGRTVALGRGEVAHCPDLVRLPCRDCGHMLVSNYRGRRFRRTCGGECYAYAPKPPQHPRGGVTFHTPGLYRKRRRGSTVGVEDYGQTLLCLHPDCLTLLWSTRGDEQYCASHAGRREQARRLRRSGPPKHRRFAFEMAAGMNGVQYAWGPRAEHVSIELGQTRVARDDEELSTLAMFVAQGALIAVPRAGEPIDKASNDDGRTDLPALQEDAPEGDALRAHA